MFEAHKRLTFEVSQWTLSINKKYKLRKIKHFISTWKLISLLIPQMTEKISFQLEILNGFYLIKH